MRFWPHSRLPQFIPPRGSWPSRFSGVMVGLLTLLALLALAALADRAHAARPDAPPRPAGARLPALSRTTLPAGRILSSTPLPASAPAPPPADRKERFLTPESAWVHHYVDMPCDVFLPAKANPNQRASTLTALEQTTDGYFYSHGYSDFSQTYDLVVGGVQMDGILLQDAVGIACASIPPELTATNVDWVEFHFTVRSTNNIPDENVGIVDMMDSTVIPHSQSTETMWDEWFYDARGLWGSLYFDGHLDPRAYVIDLGPQARLDLEARVGAPGWFGVGMAADGWDLGSAPGLFIYNRSVGGGDATPAQRPFFRVYYNAPPAAFALTGPADGAQVTTTRPDFSWQAACDPDFGDVVRYTLEYDVTPAFAAPVTIPNLSTTSFRPNVPLAAPHSYWWRVRAIDSRQNVRLCTAAFNLSIDPTAAVGDDAPPAGPRLGWPTPNPMSARLEVPVKPGAAGRISVYDVLGRRVAHLPFAAGAAEAAWDGRLDSGAPAPNGTYYLSLEDARRREVRAVRLIR